ncbi:MAG: hypothetical protein N2515_01575 [Deltaproteobacteria bacterium]|nr:hypothetical protein [Deltaproteobacteria bacterium]
MPLLKRRAFLLGNIAALSGLRLKAQPKAVELPTALEVAKPSATDFGGPKRHFRIDGVRFTASMRIMEPVLLDVRRITAPTEWLDALCVGSPEGLILISTRSWQVVERLPLGPIDVRPLLLPGSRLFVANAYGEFFVINWDGEIIVRRAFQSLSAPPLLLPDGSMVLGTRSRMLWRLDGMLRPIWSQPIPERFGAGPIQAPSLRTERRIAVGAGSAFLEFDLGGHLLHAIPLEGRVISAPAVDGDGGVMLLLNSNEIVRIEGGSRIAKRIAFEGRGLDPSTHPLGIAPDASLRLAVGKRGLLAIDPDGSLRWSFESEMPFHGPIVLDERGHVLVADRRGRLLLVDDRGSMLCAFELEAMAVGFPSWTSGQWLCFATEAPSLVRLSLHSNQIRLE